MSDTPDQADTTGGTDDRQEQQEPERTFTQADLERIVGERSPAPCGAGHIAASPARL